jgi:hypothetical protein
MKKYRIRKSIRNTALVLAGALSLIGCSRQSPQINTPNFAQRTVFEEQVVSKNYAGMVLAVKHGKITVLTPLALSRLERNGVPASIATNYAEHFINTTAWADDEIFSLYNAGVMPEEANAYPINFPANVVATLHKLKSKPEVVKKYNPRFSLDNIIRLVSSGISPEQANTYSSKFSAERIRRFREGNISPEVANSFQEKLNLGDDWQGTIETLVSAGLNADDAAKYGQDASNIDNGNYVAYLFTNKVPADVFVKYDSSFRARSYRISSEDQIAQLYKASIMPEEANKYADLNKRFGVSIRVESIQMFKRENIPFSEVAERARTLGLDKAIVR